MVSKMIDIESHSESFEVEGLSKLPSLIKCKHCDNSFTKDKALRKHMKRSHFRLVEALEEKEDDDEEYEKDLSAVNQSIDEKLLVQDEEENQDGTLLDEDFPDSVQLDEIELDGAALSMDDIQFDIDGNIENINLELNETGETMNNKFYSTEEEFVAENLDESSKNEVQATEKEDLDSSTENDDKTCNENTEPAIDAIDSKEEDSADNEGIEDPMNNETSLDERNGEVTQNDAEGESITMDDDAFDLLENAMQMTMTVPDEDDAPLSSRKRKLKKRSSPPKKRGRPSKSSKKKEIVLDGEAIVEHVESTVDDDDDDIIMVDEVNIVQKDSDADKTDSDTDEGDDPDFAPANINAKKPRISKPVRSSTRNKGMSSGKQDQKSSSKIISLKKPIRNLTIKTVEITPKERENKNKVNVKITPVSDRRKSKILESIPKSTRIVFSPSNDTKAASKEPSIDPKRMLCSICKGMFMNRQDFNSHMVKFHQQIKTSEPAVQAKKKGLDRGSIKILQEIVQCSKCKLKLNDKEALQTHRQTHLIKCSLCSFVGETKMKVIEHKKQQHNFKCQKCKQSFETKANLDKHSRDVHSFKCGKCNIVFDAKYKQDDHNKKSHYFPCDSCDKVFDMKQRLMSHQKALHQSCDVCEDEFSWPEPGHSCYYTKNNVRPKF